LYRHSCVSPEECPRTNAIYSHRVNRGTCEAPFTCSFGRKMGGQNEGEKCQCRDRVFCSECTWDADSLFNSGMAVPQTNYECTLCKKHMYLLDGTCMSSAACLEKGPYIPIAGATAKGGICLSLL
jgi:hypothetical protein